MTALKIASMLCVALALSACNRPASVDPAVNKELNEPMQAGASYLVEISQEVNLDFVHDAGELGSYPMPQIMGSGAALFDYNQDGRLDIYLVNGGHFSSQESAAPVRGQLFRQEVDGAFTNTTQESKLNNAGYGMGTAVGDIDNDGDLDLYVTNYGPDRLFQNNGNGTFTDISKIAGLSNNSWGTAACFFDYDQDGWLDLFIVNYLDYYPGSMCEDGSGRRDYCGPTAFDGTVDRLYRNQGVSSQDAMVRFSDVTVSSGISTQSGPGLGVLCRDFDGDYRPDIYVANDMQPNRLWIQQPDGTFRDEALLRGVAVNQLGDPEASMGIAYGDLDGSGPSDFFLTHLRGETNTFYANSGAGLFRDATAQSGLGPSSLSQTGFGVVAVDLEHDGDLDLAMVNGRVKRAPPLPSGDVDSYWNDYAEPNQIFMNKGAGQFAHASHLASPFSERIEVSRALACGDIDNDGDLDLLVTNCGGHARLYRNEFPKRGNWLMIRAVDSALHRDAFGARVTVHVGERMVQREVNPSSSYLSSHDVRVHFGLGEAAHYDAITVQWPDGTGETERFPGGKANQFLTLKRGAGQRNAGSQP